MGTVPDLPVEANGGPAGRGHLSAPPADSTAMAADGEGTCAGQ